MKLHSYRKNMKIMLGELNYSHDNQIMLIIRSPSRPVYYIFISWLINKSNLAVKTEIPSSFSFSYHTGKYEVTSSNIWSHSHIWGHIVKYDITAMFAPIKGACLQMSKNISRKSNLRKINKDFKKSKKFKDSSYN
jgi:hypothetical protein